MSVSNRMALSPLLGSPSRARLATPALALRGSVHGSRRNFFGAALGDAIIGTAEGLASLHGAGIPWYVCIPLVSAGVNFTMRLPLQYYARRAANRRLELEPLVKAWAARHAVSVPRGGVSTKEGETRWMLRVAGLTGRSRGRIYRVWGVQPWKGFVSMLVPVVPFVFVSEATRRLAGAPVGAISASLGLSGPEWSSLFDPSLCQGGCLWFSDLTVADPYLGLPLLCSTFMAWNIWGSFGIKRIRAIMTIDGSAGPQTLSQRIRTVILRIALVAPFIPLLFAQMPSVVFLYWSTSFALGNVNTAILTKVCPKPETTLAMALIPARVKPYLRGTDYSAPEKR